MALSFDDVIKEAPIETVLNAKDKIETKNIFFKLNFFIKTTPPKLKFYNIWLFHYNYNSFFYFFNNKVIFLLGF